MRAIKLFIILSVVLSGCDLFRMKDAETSTLEEVPVARVHDQYLYREDLEGITKPGISAPDSANITQRYIDSWVKKQLMLAEAAANIDFNEADLERKLLDYKYSLMVYEYEKDFVNKELDKNVSAGEIENHYKENIENFQLKQNIIRCIYIKVPQGAPKIENVKQWVISNSDIEKEHLRSYTYRFADSYNLEDTTWINFEEIIANTPLMGIPDKVQFLKKNKFIETSDDQYNYYLYIIDYKISDEISPLAFVKDQIRNIIINRRKVDLAGKLEQKVYTKASKENDFEIYNHN